MPSRLVTDADILKACLQVVIDGYPATTANVARCLGMGRSSVHRRLYQLQEAGHVYRYGLRKGTVVWRLKPSSLDLNDGFREGRVEVYWQSTGDGRIYLGSSVV